MTILADIPQSGIYLQRGSIVQLVVQLIDQNTGLPLQLQTATGLAIHLLYPDLGTTLDVTAKLYTDGSDGRIYYNTVNTSNQVDLSQVGLYQMQGSAVMGGIQQPPSQETDFYVLPNVDDAGNPPNAYTAQAFILFDSSNVRWAITVTATTPGTFVATAQPTGPANAVTFNPLVLKDANGVYWTITITTQGVLGATAGGLFSQAVDQLTVIDALGNSHVITVSTTGVLTSS
jgi:hypothetical protein